MSLITHRPKNFNDVVGQTRAIRVLTAILTKAIFIPRGVLLEGAVGTGKTSVGYLLARSLMCHNDPLGCNSCPSCILIAEQGIEQHPDFLEVDAASNRGVENARNILLQAESLSVIGKRRVVLIDEAHDLTTLAWDVFLKPLEVKDNNSVFIFASSEGDSIPKTIRSRCAKARFNIIPEDLLLGLLCNTANAHNIKYDMDAMKLIARVSKGIVRDAYTTLDSVASMGLVTKELVQAVVDTSLDDSCVKIFLHILRKEQIEACKICDEACGANSPVKVIQTMFEVYGRAIFKPEGPAHEAIRVGLSNISLVTSVFIKWSLLSSLPLDAMPLFIIDMMNMLEPENRQTNSQTYVISGPSKADMAEEVLNIRELLQQTGGHVD